MSVPNLQAAWHSFKVGGDPRSRDALISHYAYLVKITAGRVVTSLPPNVERDDLISAGIIGLIKAIDQYDTKREVKFETYAIDNIRGAIFKMLSEEGRVPRSVRERVKALERTYLDLEGQLGRPATDEEVAEAMGIEIDSFHALLADTGRASLLSLDDAVLSTDGNEKIHLADVVHDDTADTSGEVESGAVKQSLGEGIERLPDRERLVIALYYYEGLTVKEIGKILEVSESRVYQLHTQAVLRLRGYLQRDLALFH